MGMTVAAGVGVMMTMTSSSSAPLWKDCDQRPVVPHHEQCQDCLVRIARPKP